jgi:hypothetical protein
MKGEKGLGGDVPPGTAGPSGRMLRTCPRGHETCWPEACPVCRARGAGYAPKVGANALRSATMKASWAMKKHAKDVAARLLAEADKRAAEAGK